MRWSMEKPSPLALAVSFWAVWRLGCRLLTPTRALVALLLLEGVTMDFVDTPTKSGLAFINPHQAPCACSSSGDAAAPQPPGVARIEVGSIGRGRPAALAH